MKTLEEVIWAVENCDSAIDDCAHCAYFEEDCENLRPLRDDALFYLKEYRDYRNADKTVTENDNVSNAKNESLTWDELREMEGKPVWVEESAANGLWWTYWVIWQDENAVLPEKNYGTTWRAYRKERG